MRSMFDEIDEDDQLRQDLSTNEKLSFEKQANFQRAEVCSLGHATEGLSGDKYIRSAGTNAHGVEKNALELLACSPTKSSSLRQGQSTCHFYSKTRIKPKAASSFVSVPC